MIMRSLDRLLLGTVRVALPLMMLGPLASVTEAADRPPVIPQSSDSVLYAIEQLPEHTGKGELRFTVRIENRTKRAIRVPTHIAPGGGYVLISLIDPDGQEMRFLDELFEDFHGGQENTVTLMPGSFYGQLTSLCCLSKTGRYQLTLVLTVPDAPSIPDLVRGQHASPRSEFTVE